MDTRTRLVQAAQELLWERGYAATSPKDILNRAGAGQGSMYHPFAGKQELAVAALEESAAAMRADADELLNGEGSALDRVIAYLERQRDSLRGCRMGRMTYDADVLATPELLRCVSGTLGWLVDAIATVIRRGIDRQEFPSAPTHTNLRPWWLPRFRAATSLLDRSKIPPHSTLP